MKERNTRLSMTKQKNEAKSLICISGSDLFIWDNSDNQIVHCNLKAIASSDSETESKPSIANLQAADLQSRTQSDEKYQELKLGYGLSVDVDGISANRSCSHVVVWGPQGIRVLELPRRWGRNSMFEGGKHKITCRTIPIGERIFSCGPSLNIRQVSWHPGSKTDSHLAVLTSDNKFSIYDFQDPEEPISVIDINTGYVSTVFSPNKTFVGSALGETGVAFDFGSPLTLNPKQRAIQVMGATSASPIEVWPIYCVRGSGDVMVLYSHLSQFSPVKLPVHGPLMMCPPAEDNYGVDACSILCLPTELPVIVISTCEGRVHNCIQLSGGGDVEEDRNSTLDSSSFDSPSGSGRSCPYEMPPEPVLHVIETAELELTLSLPRLDDTPSLDDDFMCPVRLLKDGNSKDRYHCAHAAGVHSVALPWLNSVLHYFLDDIGEFPEEKECIVEHNLCTKPLHSCPSAPILGMDVVTDPILGATLVILSSDYDFTTFPIGLQYQIPSYHNRSDQDDINVSSPLKHISRESFLERMKHILQRNFSNPLLKSGANADLSQKECFQLLSRATQVLREEYIQRQDQARQEMDTRIGILRDQKDQQVQDIKGLLDSRLMLTENARATAEKLENCKENHEALLKRLETILRRLQNQVPSLSEAERKMLRELKQIKEDADTYLQSIEQVRKKQEYQEAQLAKAKKEKSLNLESKQCGQIHDVLLNIGTDIEELKNDVNRLNMAFS